MMSLEPKNKPSAPLNPKPEKDSFSPNADLLDKEPWRKKASNALWEALCGLYAAFNPVGTAAAQQQVVQIAKADKKLDDNQA